MIEDEPQPDSLGKRQHDLNIKVNEAVAKKIKFDDVKDETETHEIDKFFKIDLAAKCKNVNYILDILKSEDTLYVHRALKKCKWIFSDEYSQFINPTYLESNIFPVTSMRVKRLILNTVVMHIRKEDRAEQFYHYCMKIKMTNFASKCLLFTNEELKLTLMLTKNEVLQKLIIGKKLNYIRFIIGKSFTLLGAYMEILTKDHEIMIFNFKSMYWVDSEKYLDLLEKYINVDENNYKDACATKKIAREICEDIMKKFKHRVLAKPIFYLEIIHLSILIKNITPEEAKVFIVAILPQSSDAFWECKFDENRGQIFLQLIPHCEIYQLLKNIFIEKYPNEEFEMDAYFYHQNYHKYMTMAEREEWALNQIKSEKQVLGVGNDYTWYKFVNFDEAFEAMKKFIIVTKEPVKRGKMLTTLVELERNNCELETLFQYFIKRHLNEAIPIKVDFVNTVITSQNVFEFDDPCWSEFYTILLNLEIYNDSSIIDFDTLDNYRNVSLFYHILYNKVLPENLMAFFLDGFTPRSRCKNRFSIDHLLEKLNDHKRLFLFKYIHTFYTDKIKEYKNVPYTNVGKGKTERFFKVILGLVEIFNVYDLAHIKTQNHRPQKVTRNRYYTWSDQFLINLKKNTEEVVKKIPELTQYLFHDNKPVNIDKFINKIKIYFPNDLAPKFLNMYEDLIFSKDRSGQMKTKSADICVNGVFKLGNESRKIKFMERFVPENIKIDLLNTDDFLKLTIRKAICRWASNSLPPMPLNNMLPFVKGDYARYCLHIFSVYVAALPMTKCIELVQSVLDSPVSIQKHALRLAVECFTTESLKNVIEDIWKKTKNVSLRGVIYKGLFNRIVDKNESELYDNLITFTLDLHEDDQSIIFKLVFSDTLPNDFMGMFKKAAWITIGKFNNKEPNISRKTSVIKGIRTHLNIMDQEFVRDNIINDHLNAMFVEDKLELNYSHEDIAKLYVEKWNLTVSYILNKSGIDETAKKIKLVKYIVNTCLKMWNEMRSGNYIYQHCCWEFIQNLNDRSVSHNTQSEYLISFYEGIVDSLESALPLHVVYLPKWEFQLVICCRRIMENEVQMFENDDKGERVKYSAARFGTEVGKLVSEYVQNQKYFTPLSEIIKGIVLKRIKELLKVIFKSSNEYTKFLNSALTSFATSLTEFKIMETYLLAVQILPSDINVCDDCSRENYQFVMDEVLKCSYPAVLSLMHQKTYKPFKRITSKPQKRIKVSEPSLNQGNVRRKRMRSRRPFNRER